MRKLLSNQGKAVTKTKIDFKITISFGKLKILGVLVIYRRYPFSEC